MATARKVSETCVIAPPTTRIELWCSTGRTWERGVESHDAGCEKVRRFLEPPSETCACRKRLEAEVTKRREEKARSAE